MTTETYCIDGNEATTDEVVAVIERYLQAGMWSTAAELARVVHELAVEGMADLSGVAVEYISDNFDPEWSDAEIEAERRRAVWNVGRRVAA